MELKTIAPKDLAIYQREEQLILIDLRDPEDYRKHHIPTAVNLPYDLLDKNPGLLRRNQGYLLYCQRGNLSFLLTKKLAMMGYQVLNLYGGIHAYDNLPPQYHTL